MTNQEIATELLAQIRAAAECDQALVLGPQAVKNLLGLMQDLLRSLAGEQIATPGATLTGEDSSARESSRPRGLQRVLGLLDEFTASYERAWASTYREDRLKAFQWDMAQLRRKIEQELSDEPKPDETDRLLRSSVPERWKDCTSPIGAVQSYIAELEQRLKAHGEHPLDPPEKSSCDHKRNWHDTFKGVRVCDDCGAEFMSIPALP